MTPVVRVNRWDANHRSLIVTAPDLPEVFVFQSISLNDFKTEPPELSISSQGRMVPEDALEFGSLIRYAAKIADKLVFIDDWSMIDFVAKGHDPESNTLPRVRVSTSGLRYVQEEHQ